MSSQPITLCIYQRQLNKLTMQSNHSAGVLNFQLGLLESCEGLLLATDVSTTCAKPSSRSSHLTLNMASTQAVEMSVANNSPSQDSITWMIFFNQGMSLLGSNHFLFIRRLDQTFNPTAMDAMPTCKIVGKCKEKTTGANA